MRAAYLITGIVTMFLVGCISQPPGLEFTAGPCDESIDPRQEDMGIKDTHWVDDTTLVITAMVGLNCAEKIESGDYKIIGNTIILEYTAPKCEVCATCECAHELTYRFTNLEKKDYSYELERITE